MVPSSRPAVSIRRHLQATSLLAVLAGYVVLLLVNRQLSTRVRHERHAAQVQETTRLLQELLPEQPNLPALNLSGLRLDSRAIEAGEGFVALAGARTHGLLLHPVAAPPSWGRSGSGASAGARE